jgi:hypothetical protein
MESSADGAPSEPWPTQLGLIGFGFRWPKKTEEDGSDSLESEVEQVLEEARVVLGKKPLIESFDDKDAAYREPTSSMAFSCE